MAKQRNYPFRSCVVCGKDYQPNTGNSKSCSDICKKSASALLSKSYETMLNRRLGQMLSSARHRANLYDKAFDLDIDFIRDLYFLQGERCAITGERFRLRYSETHKHAPDSLSLDQITAGKGYTKDNVRLVTYQCNVALNQWGEERLREFAKLIVESQR